MSKLTILPLCLVTLFLCTKSFSYQNDGVTSFQSPLLVKRNQRTPIVATEFGEISTVQIADEYHIQFITLEPNALLLPLLLHSDMVFFVHTGSGILNWIDEEKERTLELRQGDVFRLRSGTVFYVHSNLERDEFPEKLNVYAIFDVGKCLYDPCLGAYSNIRDLLFGFDEKTLRSAFAVPEEVLGKLRDAAKPPLITNALRRNRTQGLEEETWQSRLVKLFVRVEDVTDHLAMKPVINSKKKKSDAYNVFEADPDFENVNGQSIVVDEKDMDALKGSSVGVYMVNLTKGSMMGPHWNPNACEISVVLRGEGMIRVVNYSSSQSMSKSESERFMVEEGDVFVVPQFHPMAQLSFLNSSFMFMGFSTSAKTNHPQFLVGQSSVLKVFDREILATSFNVRNEIIEKLLGAQKEGVMLECVSCAEVELSRLMREIEERKRREEEEIERRRKEEEMKREEEEAKRQEEERKRREEEETERKRKEEEEARKREEQRKREEAAAKKREEERRRREEEEAEARKREETREREEEIAKRQEEERRRREKEEEEARKREEGRKREEEAAKRQEEERKRREEEETERKRKEEEEARKREEQRKREEAAAKKREEERRRREEEEEEARKREEARESEEEKAKRQEEERRKREKEEEEARKREEGREREEEEAKRREEERIRREKEKEAARKREEEREKEEEIAKRREEERQMKEREEAERKRHEEQERERREEEAMRSEKERQREEMAKREEERKREEEAVKRAEEERRRREEDEKQRPPPQSQPPIDH